MITQKSFKFLLKKYTNAVKKLWDSEKEFIKNYIEQKGKNFKYYQKPIENMINIFGNYNNLLKRVKKDIGVRDLSKIKKVKSFILTPGNIPLIEIQYLYFLILTSKKIIWRPSSKFIEISKKLLKYLKKEGINFIELTDKDITQLTKEIKNYDWFVLIGSDKTIEEFKKNINKNKILEYGSKTSVSIIFELDKKIDKILNDILYFSHAGCLSPTIFFVKKEIKKEFLDFLIKKLKKAKNIFNKEEKLFNFYLARSENGKKITSGEFYILDEPKNLIISKGFINVISFNEYDEIIEKIKKLSYILQGLSVYPYKRKIVSEIRENFRFLYIREAGNLQLIDEDFYPDNIKPLTKFLEFFEK